MYRALQIAVLPWLHRICLLALFLSGLSPFALADSAKIKIGVPTSLTGDGANYGQDVRDALLFANSVLGNSQYELIFEDDHCNGMAAVTATKKLLEIDKVDYVIGFACSGAALSALPILEKAKVVTIVSLASSPKIADAGDYIFRTMPSDQYVGSIVYNYVKDKHRTVAVLAEETEYAQDLKNHFVRANRDNQLDIIEDSYLPGTTDFRTQLLKLKQKKPEGLLIITQAERTFLPILDQLKQLHWSPKLYGFYWPGSPVLLTMAGDKLEGIIFADTPTLDDILNEHGQKLYEEYQKRYGAIRSIEAAFATSFEAFRALHLAIQSGKDLKTFLSNAKLDGIFGSYSFDKKGEIVGLRPVLKIIRDGKVRLLATE